MYELCLVFSHFLCAQRFLAMTSFSVWSSFRLLKQQGFSEEELHAFQGWPNSTLQRLCVPMCVRDRKRVDFNFQTCVCEVKGTSYFYAPRTWWYWQQAAGSTPQAFYELYRKSQGSKILTILDSLVSVWNEVNQVHENYELKHCKCVSDKAVKYSETKRWMRTCKLMRYMQYKTS